MAKAQESSFESWNPEAFNRNASYQNTIREFTSDLIRGDVLDVGCGSRVFYSLANAQSWTGVDISKRMIDSIEFVDRIPKMDLQQGDVLKLPFKDGSFDTVCCLFLLHHVAKDSPSYSHERVTQAYREIFRVLRPGGKLIVAENCRGFVQFFYHMGFAFIYKAALKLTKTEMPYFWRMKDYEAFGEKAGFTNPYYVYVPMREAIYNPIFRFSLPPSLLGNWLQRMTIFSYTRP